MRRSACNPCALIPIHFNPRIVRKRCDSFYLASLLFVDTFQSTHRTQTMRQFIEASAIESRSISIHASYANDATSGYGEPTRVMADFNPRIVRKRCDKEIKRSRDEGEISIHASYANDATSWQTILLCGEKISIHASYANDATYLPSVAVTGVLISIHASYANDATQLVFLTQSFRVISIHASYANDATDLYVQKIVFRGHFNPRIVRKRCDGY